ncbi:hypothetical protein [Actinomadura fibrosa]|uniref:Uncharacterized protein n=1 Tax=Actinomadura fibrosa TaxID=111802 RepID=A0ABW2XVH1_9ACTN|nr:hypothetical protein [Actinomadura fibrosa]
MSVRVRRILEVKPGESWLGISEGCWVFDAPPGHSRVRLARAAVWLLPLVERPRDEVEERARVNLVPGDPDLREPIQTVIGAGLSGWSDYWMSRTLDWMAADEVAVFADQVHRIALMPTSASQRTQHAAKALLKAQGLWAP